jgi:hypothetical protein
MMVKAADSRSGNHSRRRVSEILRSLIGDQSNDRLSLGDIVAALEERGYGILLLVFTLPSLVPIYLPGLAAIFGPPLGFIALQLMLGRPAPWLPRVLMQRSFPRSGFARLVNWSLPYVERAERFLRPRRLEFTSPLGERLIGTACLVLTLILMLPIPLTNIPLAVPLALLSLGLLERDGWFVLAGFILGFAAVVAVLVLSWALLVELALPLIERLV